MRFMLLAGVAFWSTITFLGVRKAYENGGNGLTEKLRTIHRLHPGSLMIAGLAGVAAGVGLELVEIGRIGRMAGSIGGYASLGPWSALSHRGTAGSMSVSSSTPGLTRWPMREPTPSITW